MVLGRARGEIRGSQRGQLGRKSYLQAFEQKLKGVARQGQYKSGTTVMGSSWQMGFGLWKQVSLLKE